MQRLYAEISGLKYRAKNNNNNNNNNKNLKNAKAI